MKLSEHFDAEEFACRCGCGTEGMDPRLIDALERLRVLVGAPLIITSGRRCPTYNRQVGGAPHSQHLQGAAADVRCATVPPDRVADLAETVPAFYAGGIGRYLTFTHLDVRQHGPGRWDYRPKR